MKFRKKPVVIEAVQWDGSYASTKAALQFMDQCVNDDPVTQKRFEEYVNCCVDSGMYITTLEGQMCASVGDYIIKGINGEFYPCKPDIFAKTYEPVD